MQNTARDIFLLLDYLWNEAVAPGKGTFNTKHIPGEGISGEHKTGPAVSAVNAAGLLCDWCRPTGPTPAFLLSASWARATGKEDFIDGMRSMATNNLSSHHDSPGDAPVKSHTAGWTLPHYIESGNQPPNTSRGMAGVSWRSDRKNSVQWILEFSYENPGCPRQTCHKHKYSEQHSNNPVFAYCPPVLIHSS